MVNGQGSSDSKNVDRNQERVEIHCLTVSERVQGALGGRLLRFIPKASSNFAAHTSTERLFLPSANYWSCSDCFGVARNIPNCALPSASLKGSPTAGSLFFTSLIR